MWVGGVRVIVEGENGKILMVKQCHEGRDIWMAPGGGIEEGETSVQAAVREVKEETGLDIRVGKLLWHVEDVTPERGQRFVMFFLGEVVSGILELGADPEFDENHQVLKETGFFSLEEIMEMENIYPEYMRTELGIAIEKADMAYNTYRIRQK